MKRQLKDDVLFNGVYRRLCALAVLLVGAALHRVDQEIQHMLENARLLAKAA